MIQLRKFKKNVHGVLLLDKPSGLSSNRTLQKVKRIYEANHAGYIGTLDPIATGMLPICFGEATKFSQYLLNSDKQYRVIAKLGQQTDTSDANGRIIKEKPVLFSKEELNSALEKFKGNVLQVPSMYSAIKYQGKELYKYARKGITVPRTPRVITIYKLLLIRCVNNEIELEIHCSKGTYIRTIIEDLGKKLSCGAHVIFLRRLSVSFYPQELMITMNHLEYLVKRGEQQGISKDTLLSSLLMPLDSPISNYPSVNLSLELSSLFRKGNFVYIYINVSLKGLVRVTEGKKEKFIGTGMLEHTGRLFPHRLVNI